MSDAEKARGTADRLAELRNTLRRAERTAHKEAKDVSEVEEALASEARDKEILTHELHQLLNELAVLGAGNVDDAVTAPKDG